MLREALTYPLRGERAEQSLLVGTSLAVAAGLLARLGSLAILAVVPAILLAGYALAVLRESTASGGATSASAGDTSASADASPADASIASTNAESPPAFTDVSALAVDGVRVLAVAVGYLAIPAIALGLTVGGSVPAESMTAGTSLLVLGAGTVVLFVALSFAYLLPAALIAVARSGRLRSAVGLGRLHRSVADARYFVGWAGALSVVAVVALLFDALAALGRPGEVIGLAVGFYATVVVARLLGQSVAG